MASSITHALSHELSSPENDVDQKVKCSPSPPDVDCHKSESKLSKEADGSKNESNVIQSKEAQAPQQSPSIRSTHICALVEKEEDESITEEIGQSMVAAPDVGSGTQIRSCIAKVATTEDFACEPVAPAPVIEDCEKSEESAGAHILNAPGPPVEELNGKLASQSNLSNDSKSEIESQTVVPDEKLEGKEIESKGACDAEFSSGINTNPRGNGKARKIKPCMIRVFRGKELDEKFIYTSQDMVNIVHQIMNEDVDSFEIEEVQTASYDRLKFSNKEGESEENSSSDEVVHMTPVSELFSIIQLLRAPPGESIGGKAHGHDQISFKKCEGNSNDELKSSDSVEDLIIREDLSGNDGIEAEEKTPTQLQNDQPILRSLDLNCSRECNDCDTPLNSAASFSFHSQLDQMLKSPGACDKYDCIEAVINNLITLTVDGSPYRERNLSVSGQDATNPQKHVNDVAVY